MRPVKLFATDLDGTLLDRQGRVRDRDREAIARARSKGLVVTIATGRLVSGTLPIARSLGLDVPFVCADGAVLANPSTGAPVHTERLPSETVLDLLSRFDQHGIAKFVFTKETIHGCERGSVHHRYVSGWAPEIVTHSKLEDATWTEDEHGPVFVVGIGGPEVDTITEWTRRELSGVEDLTFNVAWGEHRVIRIIRRGTSKGTGLTRLAETLGFRREDIAVAGDWHNDLPMFQLAARSFAMDHAPDDVKAAATDVLPQGVYDNGGVAAAIEALGY